MRSSAEEPRSLSKLTLICALFTGGAVGGATGALVGMGISEYEAKRYEGRLQKGGILMSVHCGAKEILERSGAEDISSTSESSVDSEKREKPTTRNN